MTDTPDSQFQQDRRDAAVVSRHLPEGYSAGPDVLVNDSTASSASQSAPDLSSTPPEQSSLKLLGGDMHRDIYKIQARAKMHQRSKTFANPTSRTEDTFSNGDDSYSAADQLAPGGFRRQYVVQQQQSVLGRVATAPTRNFVSFLELYGSFAGEDLAESEDESAIAEDEEEAPERRPLLPRRKSTKRMRAQGNATVLQTFFTLLKAFIGTGIMFLPKAFRNGGILFSSITLITVAIVSMICFELLLSCKQRVKGGYGEIGEAILGPQFRKLVLTSIFLSQIGFVCAGMIFTAENMYSFLEAVSKTGTPLTVAWLIGLQLIIILPLALIRDIGKLGPAALLADVFILIGLVYIWQYDISTLSRLGMHKTVTLFNANDFTLTIGSAIFTFEGIGLILPIQASMAEPAKFSKLLGLVMLIITCIFTSIGALCYATFGDATRVEIITNFPQTSKLVNAVQFLYALAVVVGTPVQLFPAVRIIETSVFGERSGRRSTATKWKKNAFRTGLSILCAFIAIFGASDLDKFVALIGSFACIPLVYIYPALLHFKSYQGGNVLVKVGDCALAVVGIGLMVYSTGLTIAKWSA